MTPKTCIITGASRGIGLAAAQRFARHGDNVIAVARGERGLDEASGAIREAGGTCVPIAADVAEPDDVVRVVNVALQRFGRIDVLVNNAGYAPLAPLDGLSEEDFARAIRINIEAVYRMTRAVWGSMKRQGGGVVVNVSSVASVDPFPGFAVYGGCKAFVNTFTRALADEGKQHGIRTFAIAPGAVETQMLREAFQDFPRDKTLDPDHVAALIEAVCGEALAYSSGQTIFVRR